MREILFRAKSLKNNKWVLGYYYKSPHPITAIPVDFIASKTKFNVGSESFEQSVDIVDPNTLSQYIYMTDENRNKIFENDIVKISGTYYINKTKSFEIDNLFIVKYGVGSIEFIRDSDYFKLEEAIYLTLSDLSYDYKITLLGNIFDNKELLNDN